MKKILRYGIECYPINQNHDEPWWITVMTGLLLAFTIFLGLIAF